MSESLAVLYFSFIAFPILIIFEMLVFCILEKLNYDNTEDKIEV